MPVGNGGGAIVITDTSDPALPSCAPDNGASVQVIADAVGLKFTGVSGVPQHLMEGVRDANGPASKKPKPVYTTIARYVAGEKIFSTAFLKEHAREYRGTETSISHNPRWRTACLICSVRPKFVFVFIFALHFSLCTPMHASTAGGRCRALRATMECSRGTTSYEKDVEDEGDMPPPLEGEDDEDGNLTSGVADCARRETWSKGQP